MQNPVTISTILGSTTVIKDVTENPQRMKFIFSSFYDIIKMDINTKFLEDLKSGLARMLLVSTDRITEVEITPSPKGMLLALRFFRGDQLTFVIFN